MIIFEKQHNVGRNECLNNPLKGLTKEFFLSDVLLMDCQSSQPLFINRSISVVIKD